MSVGHPVLVYDGDCRFCASCVDFVTRRVHTSAEIVAWQLTDLDALGTTQERAQYELLWIDASGRIDGGAQAVAQILVDAGGAWRPLGRAMRVPPVRWVAHVVYRVVANNRHRLPGGTPACAIPAEERSGIAR
ncbi:MAG: thiol-disulfide oxidoreductase DCC family protein [Jiangellaceae bacterium]